MLVLYGFFGHLLAKKRRINVTGNLLRKLLQWNTCWCPTGSGGANPSLSSMNKTCRTCRKLYPIGKMQCDEYRHWQCVRCAALTALRGERYARKEPKRCPGCGGKIITDPCVYCSVSESRKRKSSV